MSDKDKIVTGKMIKYCEDSVKYIERLDFDSFCSDELVLTFSIFSLSQLGELVPRLSEEVKSKHSEVPWNALKSIRNRIVHDYDGVQYRVIWDTLVNDIPPLTEQLRKMIELHTNTPVSNDAGVFVCQEASNVIYHNKTTAVISPNYIRRDDGRRSRFGQIHVCKYVEHADVFC